MRARIKGILLAEAERYRLLAAGEALEALDSIGDEHAQIARRHLVRAETFNAAAELAGGAV